MALEVVRARRASDSEVSDAKAEMLERLIVLHAAFNAAHLLALAAVRTDNVSDLAAAGARQSEVMSQQCDVIDRYLATCLVDA